eukprot:TRINITY_DN17379_c0_g1_i1.p1 TRINITY_DN17379_c0_g1~~TRINITY_DN17379_c0_g1_i1.p1  ORF type:complete len:343 (-),score=56.66 TRINITY_DN17379_c0_g1_i1:48-1076(-)
MSVLARRGFWNNVPRQFLALAPMYDVTDCAYRRIIAQLGKPDVTYTEFVSSDGLLLPQQKGFHRLMLSLKYVPEERPIVAQIFGKDLAKFRDVVPMIMELGFDGVDINMGCPERSVVASGAGSGLIHNIDLAQQIIQTCIDAGKGTFPVSVKTRIGYKCIKTEMEPWIGALLDVKPDAMALHLRTKVEMSKVDAHWDPEIFSKVLKLRDEKSPGTLIMGNGDVKSTAEAKEKAEKFNIDGVMLGRAIFGKPWLFSDAPDPTPTEIVEIMERHLDIFELELLEAKTYFNVKKHLRAYLDSFNKQYRAEMMLTNNIDDARQLIHKIKGEMGITTKRDTQEIPKF